MKTKENLPTYLERSLIPESMGSLSNCRRAGYLIEPLQTHHAIYFDDTDCLGREIKLYDITKLKINSKSRRLNIVNEQERVWLFKAFKSSAIMKTSKPWQIQNGIKRIEERKGEYKPEFHLLTKHVVRFFDPDLVREIKDITIGKVVSDTHYKNTYHLIFSDLDKVVSYLESINADIKSNISNI